MSWWTRYLTIPWREHGAAETGVDCWGLVRLAYQLERGVILPSPAYPDCSAGAAAAAIADVRGLTWWRQLEAAEAEDLDVVTLLVRGVPAHVGLYVAPGRRVLHATPHGVRLEPLHGPIWAGRVDGYWRWAG